MRITPEGSGKKLRAIFFLLLAGVACPVIASGEIYKCAQKDKVIYSEFDKCAGGYAVLITRPQAVGLIGANKLQTYFDGNPIYVDVTSSGRVLPKFILDTGSSMTAIPDSLAKEMKLTCVRDVPVTTANGVVTGCITRMNDVEISGRKFPGIDVVVLPRLDRPMLGMSEITRIRTGMLWMD